MWMPMRGPTLVCGMVAATVAAAVGRNASAAGASLRVVPGEMGDVPHGAEWRLNHEIEDVQDLRDHREMDCWERLRKLELMVELASDVLHNADVFAADLNLKFSKVDATQQRLRAEDSELNAERVEVNKACKRGDESADQQRDHLRDIKQSAKELAPLAAASPKLRARASHFASTLKDQGLRLDKNAEQRAASCATRLHYIDAEMRAVQNELLAAAAEKQEILRQQHNAKKNQEKALQEANKMKDSVKYEEQHCEQDLHAFDARLRGMKLERTKILRHFSKSGILSDCSVTPLTPAGPCSKSCGGGVRKFKREIIVEGPGVKCPKTELEVTCNDHKCPVECELGEWSGWSECSQKCGGGLRKRHRAVKSYAKFGGQPCKMQDEQQACGTSRCHENCKLGAWGSWGYCTKACGGGVRGRTRAVEAPPKGLGLCPEPGDAARLQFRACPERGCPPAPGTADAEAANIMNAEGVPGLKPQARLECGAPVDFALVVDGSAMLGDNEFEQEMGFAADLAAHLVGGGPDGPRVGLVFTSHGGATGDRSAWTSPLSSEAGALKSWLRGQKRGAGGEGLPEGLVAARDVLAAGRKGVPGTVILLLRGKPARMESSLAIARQLQEMGARVVAMTAMSQVGQPPSSGEGQLEALVSPPASENLVLAQSFEELWKGLRQRVIGVCPALRGVPAPGNATLPARYIPEPPRRRAK